MKDLLFGILVIALTPIYLILSIVKLIIKTAEWIGENFIEPVEEGMLNLFENMQDFWKRVLKRNNKKEQEIQQINNKINETVEDLIEHKITPNQARERFGLPRIEGKNDN